MGKKKKASPKQGLVKKLLIWIISGLMLFAIVARVIHVFKNHL